MILKALSEYYQRMLNDPNIDIAPPGLETKPIDFVVVINKKGEFISLRDLREGEGRARRGRPMLVPKSVKRSSGIAANLLWDTPPYTLGKAIPAKGKELTKLQKRAEDQHRAFIQKLRNTFVGCRDPGIDALNQFLSRSEHEEVYDHPIWQDIVNNGGGNISFILEGDEGLICQRKNVLERVLREQDCPEESIQTCALTGEEDIPSLKHTAIKGVWGAQSSGANIVSFNLDAFCSFGKKQGLNAPIGEKAEFSYTTALNALLVRGSQQRIQFGDASTVFWAKESHSFEDDFSFFLGEPAKGQENVSYGKIRELLSSVRTGVLPKEDDMPFYVLGLSPNASRIAIRFWYEGSVRDLKNKIVQHFDDIAIVHSPKEREYLSLFQLLVSIAIERKADNIPPNLGGELARSVLGGTRYPQTLLAGAVGRCKAEQRVTRARASIIKGILIRNSHFIKSHQKEVQMALDRGYDNIGYVLGRLFAVLERIQEQAHQGASLNKTIRDTYFSAACSSPRVAFKRLQDLSVHHLAKLRHTGKGTVWLEKQMGEVMDMVPPSGIPATLPLDEQGRFAVGYYHQRQDFFTKKESMNGGEES